MSEIPQHFVHGRHTWKRSGIKDDICEAKCAKNPLIIGFATQNVADIIRMIKDEVMKEERAIVEPEVF
jgi:hypothetical protein